MLIILSLLKRGFKTQQAIKLIRLSLYFSVKLHAVKTVFLEWGSYTVDFIHSLLNVSLFTYPPPKTKTFRTVLKLEGK